MRKKTANSSINMICRYKWCRGSRTYVRRPPDILSNWICPHCSQPLIACIVSAQGRKENLQTRARLALTSNAVSEATTHEAKQKHGSMSIYKSGSRTPSAAFTIDPSEEF